MEAGVVLSFITLVGLEIILGVDNIIFIAILTDKVPRAQQRRTRITGLSLAMLMRIAMLLGIAWIARLTTPFFSINLSGNPGPFFRPGGAEGYFPFSGRDLLLAAGGVFLAVKTLIEIISKLREQSEPSPIHAVATDPAAKRKARARLQSVIFQIIIIDMLFSFDSILTAVGLVQDVRIMIAAVVVSMVFMMMASRYVADFINRFPGIRMLALLFLVLIGAHLFFEGIRWHPFHKEHLYFALVFGLLVEWLDILYRRRHPSESR